MKNWLFLIALFSCSANAEWENYFPARLADGVAIASRAEHGGFVVFREGYAFASKVVYTGKIRPLTPAVGQVLSRFLGIDRDFPLFDKKYGNEIEVMESGKAYWMAVPFDVLSEFQKKFAAGQDVTVYVRLTGKSGENWVFLMDGFSSASRKP